MFCPPRREILSPPLAPKGPYQPGGTRGAERCGCRQFHQLPGCASGRGSLIPAVPLQMRRQFLSSAGFKPSWKGLKFLLSARKSKVKGQGSPTSTEHVEHHHGKQSDAQINFLLLLTRRHHHHRQKQRVPHLVRETEGLPAH